MTANKPEQNAAKTEYEPTAQELSALGKHVSGTANQTAPKIKVLNNGMRFAPDHPNEDVGYTLLMETLGTTDLDFTKGLVEQLAIASSRHDQIDERYLNFKLAVIKGAKPRDEIEAMLAAQMAGVHLAIMRFTWLLGGAGNISEQDSIERALNKLARTFASQMDALKRYRAGGEQNVTVVSVREGGQAIVGNVTQGPPREQRDDGKSST